MLALLLLGGAAAAAAAAAASQPMLGGAAAAAPQPSLCPANGHPLTFFASAWSMTCESGTSWTNVSTTCKNFSGIVPPMIIELQNFGDNASSLVPLLIHGYDHGNWCNNQPGQDNTTNGGACEPGLVEDDGLVWPWGLDAMPAGHRAIRFSGPDRGVIMNDPADDILGGWNTTAQAYPPSQACQPSDEGQIKGPFTGLWWDRGAELLGAQSAKFFKALKAAGGQLDEIVLDTELGWEGFDTWAISDNWSGYNTSANGSAACARNHWHAIQEDKRFPAVLAELKHHGFDAGDKLQPDWLQHALHYTRNQTIDRNRRVWNAVNAVRAVAYWETTFFKAAKKYYPGVMASDIGFQKWSSEYCVPDSDSWMGCRELTALTGAVPAGDQNGYSNYVAYNDFDLLGTVAEPGYQAVLREYWGVPNFTKSAFSILQVSSTQVRGMVLGGIKASPSKPVPVKPWMSFQNYIAPDWGGRVPTCKC